MIGLIAVVRRGRNWASRCFPRPPGEAAGRGCAAGGRGWQGGTRRPGDMGVTVTGVPGGPQPARGPPWADLQSPGGCLVPALSQGWVRGGGQAPSLGSPPQDRSLVFPHLGDLPSPELRIPDSGGSGAEKSPGTAASPPRGAAGPRRLATSPALGAKVQGPAKQGSEEDFPSSRGF